MSNRRPARSPGFPGSAAWCTALLAVVVPAVVGCGGSDATKASAVAVSSGAFGAMMVSSDGEMLLPTVSRDAQGRVTAVTGALWMDAEGSSVAVFLDPATGLPSRTVFGDYELIFSNWSADHRTADIARIFGPKGYIEVYRNVPIFDTAAAVDAGLVVSAATCLPDCPTTLQTVSESLKLAGVAISAAGCYAAAGISWGAMLLPCTGYLVGAAKTLVGNEAMLDDLNGVNTYLNGIDVVQCTALMDAGACLQAALEGATTLMDKANAVITGNAANEAAAEQYLADLSMGSGVVQGIPPACDTVYHCTPGLTLKCIEGGEKTCREDCSWGDCPPPPEPPQHISGGTCQGGGTMCDCGYEACVKVSGTSIKCWYRTLLGDFPCSTCEGCEGAARAMAAACCPPEE